jgi:hypothetical protein
MTVAAQFVGAAVLSRDAGRAAPVGLSRLAITSDRQPPGVSPIRILHIDIHLGGWAFAARLLNWPTSATRTPADW